jgi:hypothetical protein
MLLEKTRKEKENVCSEKEDSTRSREKKGSEEGISRRYKNRK